MHTLMEEAEHPLFHERFAPDTLPQAVSVISTVASTGDLVKTKANLPEGFYQDRIGAVSLQTLRRIYQQRREHELPEWQQFCDYLRDNHPLAEYITARPRDTAILEAKLRKADARVQELESALRRALVYVTDTAELNELQRVCGCLETEGVDDREDSERD